MIEHPVDIRQDIVVPISYDPKSLRPQMGRAPGVGLFEMLTPVRLDDQFPIEADEVDDERPDNMLPAKLESTEARARSRDQSNRSASVLSRRSGAACGLIWRLTGPIGAE